MTKALVALHDTTYGGVYYSTNVDFVAKTNPVWARYATTGLANNLIACMQTDYADPYGTVYVQLDNGDVYKWNGASWTKIMDLATARTATGLAGGVLGLICANKTVAGRIYLPISQTTVSQYVLVSTDYGANWTARLVINYVALTDPSYVQATGNNVWLCYGHLYRSMQYSGDNGATWAGDYGIWGTTGGGDAFNIDPLDGTGCYFRASATDPDLTRYYYSGGVYGFTALQVGKGLGEIFLSAGVQVPAGAYWASWINSGKQRIIKEATGGIRMYSTVNGWTGLVEASPTDWDLTIAAGVQAIHAAREDEANVLIGCGQDAAGVPRVFAWTGEATSVLPWNCGGANYGSAPYTDSLPSPNNSYVAAYGVFCGNAPATGGIYVYSVETDIYDDDHIPMKGDRSAWQTRQYPDEHAEDVQEDNPTIHGVWPMAAGNISVSDGNKLVETTPAVFGIHDPVTLDADAALILDLSTQEIGLDVQNANTVLAGPAAGPANEPTFRALVAADIPAIALNDLSDVDTTGVDAGDILVYNGVTWEDRRQNIHKVQTITADTTLDDTYDVVIVDATAGDVNVLLPRASLNDGLTYSIKRVDDSANDATVIALVSIMTDSDGIPLTDSAGSDLYDSLGTGSDDTIDEESTQALHYLDSMTIVADKDADGWWII